MKSLVIYDSLYGNTEKVAQAIGSTLSERGEAAVARVKEVSLEALAGLDLLVVGSPTQRFMATDAVKAFLDSIPPNSLRGMKVAAFDTRLTWSVIEQTPTLAFFERIFGYAAQRIARQLRKKGGKLVVPAEGFFVEGMEGPLSEGELERAERWARGLLA